MGEYVFNYKSLLWVHVRGLIPEGSMRLRLGLIEVELVVKTLQERDKTLNKSKKEIYGRSQQ